MIENINITGATVSAELHALLYEYVFGYDGVFNYGNKLSYVIVSNNEIKINDGLLLNQGRFMRIKIGSTESVAIENGTSGAKRCDLIVAHFETNGITEIHDIRVIKGTSASEPAYIKGDTFNGATVNELPLYAVHLDGLAISSVERKFTLIDSLKDNVAKQHAILSGTTTPTNDIGNDGDIYILIE